jgi:hypothetical protein
MHPGQGIGGCYQQNSMYMSHDTAITCNGNPRPLFCYFFEMGYPQPLHQNDAYGFLLLT